MVEKYRNHLTKLIVIVTSGDSTQSANRYVFGTVPLLQIPLTEKVNKALGYPVYMGKFSTWLGNYDNALFLC